MSHTKLEEMLFLQKNQIGLVQKLIAKKLEKEGLMREYLTATLELLENYWSQVCRTHFALCEFENLADTEYMKQDIFFEVENQYIAMKTKIYDLLNEEPVAESASNETCCHIEFRTKPSKFPEFDGNLDNWEYFRDMFVAMIHNDKTIPLVKKMCYLKSCLKGEAARVISGIKISAYETAWELILRCFDNPQRRLKRDLHCLFEAEPLTETSAEGISALIQSVEQLRVSLKKVENFKDCIYLYALERRLDEETKRHWKLSLLESQVDSKNPKYEDLMNFLIEWIIFLENEAKQTSGSKSTNSKNNFKGSKSRGRKELSMNATNVTRDVRCSMCKEGHALANCRKFQELSSWKRREQVRKARACFRCLGPNHWMASCSSTIRCRYCQRKHNSLLHLGAEEFAPSQDHSN